MVSQRPNIAIDRDAVKLREFREGDTEELALLFTASIHTLAVNQYDVKQLEAWAPPSPNMGEWRQRFGGVRTIVAEDESSYLGFISYEIDGHIDLLYTSPRAARKGVASALLEEAAVQLRNLGVSDLFTEASLVAAPFFSRHGFQIVKEQSVVRRGVTFKRVAMRRSADVS